MTNGLNINFNEKIINLKFFLFGVLTDLPARSEVFNFKCPNAYDSCIFCLVKGIRFKNSMIFLEKGKKRKKWEWYSPG